MRVITTVGTSIFANYNKKDEVIRAYGELSRDYESITTPFDNLAHKSASDFTNSRYESDIEYIREIIQYLWLAIAEEKSCAELQTLYKIAEETSEKLEIYLLATDTILSVLACELMKEWVNAQTKMSVLKIETAKGLQVKNSKVFKTEGLQNLVRIVHELNDDQIALNISGGYKALIPFLTLIGQIEQIPLYYMYEDSDELISIDNMPFSFDWTLIERHLSHLFNPSLITSSKVEQELVNLGLIGKDKQLTTFGDLAKAYLINEDIPFQTTTFGYLVEYKLFEYYSNNHYQDFNQIELGKKLSKEEGKDLEDADLWMENDVGNVIIAEIKSASNRPKSLRKKIKKILGQVSDRKVIEFWLIIYEYEGSEIVNDDIWCEKVINNEIKYLFQEVRFKIKKIKINKNVIDGSRNRMVYHEFLRSSIQNVESIFSANKNQ